MLLPLQGATLPTNITQGDALGLGCWAFSPMECLSTKYT